MTATGAALLGSIATAVAIFGGGLAVEAYKRARDRDGMALALAGATDALLGLIAMRGMVDELLAAMPDLRAGRRVEFASLIRENTPYTTITLAFARQIGDLRGDLPFRVARFLTYNEGLFHDLERLADSGDRPDLQARLIDQMAPLWRQTEALGTALVADLKKGVARARAN